MCFYVGAIHLATAFMMFQFFVRTLDLQCMINVYHTLTIAISLCVGQQQPGDPGQHGCVITTPGQGTRGRLLCSFIHYCELEWMLKAKVTCIYTCSQVHY